MGLDMYLSKRHYVKNWNHTEEDRKHSVLVKKGGKIVEHIKPERITQVEEGVMYWRKANAIHRWFVDNVQEGEDNCADYYVSRADLEKLRDLCKKVVESSKLVDGKIANGYSYKKNEETKEFERVPILEDGKYIEDPSVARELLPTTEGFFFGATEYDQYYLDNIKSTLDMLEEELKEDNGGEYYYSSSW